MRYLLEIKSQYNLSLNQPINADGISYNSMKDFIYALIDDGYTQYSIAQKGKGKVLTLKKGKSSYDFNRKETIDFIIHELENTQQQNTNYTPSSKRTIEDFLLTFKSLRIRSYEDLVNVVKSVVDDSPIQILSWDSPKDIISILKSSDIESVILEWKSLAKSSKQYIQSIYNTYDKDTLKTISEIQRIIFSNLMMQAQHNSLDKDIFQDLLKTLKPLYF